MLILPLRLVKMCRFSPTRNSIHLRRMGSSPCVPPIEVLCKKGGIPPLILYSSGFNKWSVV